MAPALPKRGICAHRGASATHPENTLASLREAVRLGVHMIEFDVALTRDGRLVLMHDASVDRTTDGSGAVADLTLAELKRLDVGSWKDPKFALERIPTFDDALSIMPVNVWLNVHIKGDSTLAAKVAEHLVSQDRLHQAFIACEPNAARAARNVDSRIQVCNMLRREDAHQYARETIDMRSEFIQLLVGHSLNPDVVRPLQQHNVRINFCCAHDAHMLRGLFQSGIQFVLVDRVAEMLEQACQLGIRRQRPVYRKSTQTQKEAGLTE